MGIPSLELSHLSWRFGGWHPTPWYDWHRYCGGNMRCWVWDEEGLMFEYDGEWTYRSFQEQRFLMSAVKSFGARATREVPHPRSWTQTPTWHWRSWLGYKMRISVGFTDGRRPYDYRSHEHHARVVLEAQANGVPLQFYDPPAANRGTWPNSRRGLKR